MQKEKRVSEEEKVRKYHYSMDMNLSKLWETALDRGAWLATAHVITNSHT